MILYPPILAAAGVFLVVLLAVAGPAGRSAFARAGTSTPLMFFLVSTVGPIALLAFGLATVRWPQLPVCVLLFLCVFFSEMTIVKSVSLGFFRVYPHDVFLGLALLAAALRVPFGFAGSDSRAPAGALGRLIVLAMILGAFQTLRGIALGNEFNAAFGDFRRGYFYMIVFFLVLMEAGDPNGLRWVHRTFLIASLAIVGRGVWRLTLGRLYQMSWFDVFHVLSHTDLVFMVFLACYCFGRLMYPGSAGIPARDRDPSGPGPRPSALQGTRAPWLFLLPVTLVLIVLGNFRASWIGFVLAGLVTAALLPKPKRRVLILVGAVMLVGVAAGFYTFRNVRIGSHGETVREEVVSKFRGLVDWQTDTNVIWRIHSYGAALRIWSDHLVLGAGLGERLVFHSINAAGEQAIHFHHRAHNSLLWVGFTTGIVGVLIFSALHLTYFAGAVRRLRQLGEKPDAGVLLAYLGFYVAFMVTSLFDVILEQSPTAIALYAHMAIVWRLSPRGARASLPAEGR